MHNYDPDLVLILCNKTHDDDDDDDDDVCIYIFKKAAMPSSNCI